MILFCLAICKNYLFLFYLLFYYYYIIDDYCVFVAKNTLIIESVPPKIPTVADKHRHTIKDHLGFGGALFR